MRDSRDRLANRARLGNAFARALAFLLTSQILNEMSYFHHSKWSRKMKSYRVAISLEVAADDEEEAAREAMTKVIDPTMVIEAITELHGHKEQD